MSRVIFILFFISFQFSVAQDDEMPWRSDQKLTWEDFKSAPDHSHPYAAITFSGMSISFSGMSYGLSDDVVNGETNINYKVNCFFIASKSWVKRRYKGDKGLLKHEQLHFDITELYTRKFREELSKMTFTDNVKAEIKEVHRRITKEKTLLQEKYDLETDHSKNEAAQKRWQLKIDSELQNRIEFASK
jgi:hypothetical protein